MLDELPPDVVARHLAPLLRVGDAARLARCCMAMAKACRHAARLAGVTAGRAALHDASLRQARRAIAWGGVADVVALARSCVERPSTPYNGADLHMVCATRAADPRLHCHMPMLVVERPSPEQAPVLSTTFPLTGDAEADAPVVCALLCALLHQDPLRFAPISAGSTSQQRISSGWGADLYVDVVGGNRRRLLVDVDAPDQATPALIAASTEAVWSAARAYVETAQRLLTSPDDILVTRYACTTLDAATAPDATYHSLMRINALAFAARSHRNGIWRTAAQLDASAATTMASLWQHGEVLLQTRRAMGIPALDAAAL